MAKTNSKKKKNQIKRRLLLLILLLLLTVGLVGLQTWSWFTSNRTVSVDTLQVNVRSANGLQISADGENWDNSVNLEKIYLADLEHTDINNQLPANMENVSSPGTFYDSYAYMFYGTVESSSKQDVDTGNITTNYLLSTQDVSDIKSCNDMYTGDNADSSVIPSCTSDSSKGYYVAFDLYFKITSPAEIVIDGKSSVKAVGTDKGTKNTARVGILNLGNTSYNSLDPVASGEAARKLATATDFFIWEPNATSHTLSGTAEGSKYNVAINSTNPVQYCGINQNINNGNASEDERNIYNVKCGSKFVSNPVETFASKDKDTSNIRLGSDDSGWTIQSGITKTRVYWWVEGQDIDTENNASGSDMKLTLVFSMA